MRIFKIFSDKRAQSKERSENEVVTCDEVDEIKKLSDALRCLEKSYRFGSSEQFFLSQMHNLN